MTPRLSYRSESLNTFFQDQEADREAAQAKLTQIKERVTNLSARLATAHDQLVGAKKQRTEKPVVDVNSKDLNEKVDVLQRVINIVSERFDADGRVLLQGVSRTDP